MNSKNLIRAFTCLSLALSVGVPEAHAKKCSLNSLLNSISRVERSIARLNKKIDLLTGNDPREERFEHRKAQQIAKFQSKIENEQARNSACFDSSGDTSRACEKARAKVEKFHLRQAAIASKEFRGAANRERKRVRLSLQVAKQSTKLTELLAKQSTCLVGSLF